MIECRRRLIQSGQNLSAALGVTTGDENSIATAR